MSMGEARSDFDADPQGFGNGESGPLNSLPSMCSIDEVVGSDIVQGTDVRDDSM